MTDRPTALPVQADSIPAEMRAESQKWGGWKYVLRDGDWKKIPYQVGKPDEEAKVNVLEHWGAFDDALRLYQGGGFDGIGFLLGDGWTGIDIDDCIDQSGEINAFGHDVIALLNSYAERSPSSTGIKIFVRGWLGKNHTKKGLEAYSQGRYFTVTGHHV